MNDWKITIEVSATSFDLLKQQAARFLSELVRAASPRDVPTHNGSDGDGINYTSYNVSFETPLIARIAELRKQADELEGQLPA